MMTPNLPDELEPGKKDYSLRKDVQVNAWGYVAMAISFLGDFLLSNHKEWPAALRASIALLPVVPALLWGRTFAHWIRGMDELHRQVTIKVCLFATTATLFLFALLRPLTNAGLVRPLGLDIHTFWGTSWLLVCFYILGSRILHRRYK